MSNFLLTQINIYPVKSLPGISLKESFVEERGLKYDRRWMIVNAENVFITQRNFPNMVFINIEIDGDNLVLKHKKKNLEELKIPISSSPKDEIKVHVWDDICLANVYENKINQWFSNAIESECKLVYMPNSTERRTSTKYFPESKNVSFADGYPFLIIGEESLNYLNTKLKKPVSMNNFRPNLVFSGGIEHDEDSWKNIKIGEHKFSVVKPCARCVITTIDSNGNKNKEPLSTLSKYRNFNNKIMFGQNVITHTEGVIKIGDKIVLQDS